MEHIRGDVDRLALDLVGPSTIVAESLHHGTEITLGHADGLAIVERLDGREKVDVLLDEIGELPQQLAAVVGGSCAPLALESCAGGLHGNIDILLSGLTDGGDDLLSGGVDGLELLLLDTLDELVVDEAMRKKESATLEFPVGSVHREGYSQADGLLVSARQRGLEVDCQTHCVCWVSLPGVS